MKRRDHLHPPLHQATSHWPMSTETLPEGDKAVSADGHHPGVHGTLHLGAKTHVGVQAEAQQQAAQQCGMVLTVLQTAK